MIHNPGIYQYGHIPLNLKEPTILLPECIETWADIWGQLHLPHTEKSFRNLIKSNRIQIVFTILGFIWIETNARLFSNQSENGKYNLILI